jgi:hypothetical protein
VSGIKIPSSRDIYPISALIGCRIFSLSGKFSYQHFDWLVHDLIDWLVRDLIDWLVHVFVLRIINMVLSFSKIAELRFFVD